VADHADHVELAALLEARNVHADTEAGADHADADARQGVRVFRRAAPRVNRFGSVRVARCTAKTRALACARRGW
jgi:hypothetical protein